MWNQRGCAIVVFWILRDWLQPTYCVLTYSWNRGNVFDDVLCWSRTVMKNTLGTSNYSFLLFWTTISVLRSRCRSVCRSVCLNPLLSKVHDPLQAVKPEPNLTWILFPCSVITTQYVIESGDGCLLSAAMAVCVPWNSFESCESLEQPLNALLFNRHLTNKLCEMIKRLVTFIAPMPWKHCQSSFAII